MMELAEAHVDRTIVNTVPVPQEEVQRLFEFWQTEFNQVPSFVDRRDAKQEAVAALRAERALLGAAAEKPRLLWVIVTAALLSVIFGLLATPTVADILIAVFGVEEGTERPWIVGAALVSILIGAVIGIGPILVQDIAVGMGGAPRFAALAAGLLFATGLASYRLVQSVVDPSTGASHIEFHLNKIGLFLSFAELSLLASIYFVDSIAAHAYAQWDRRRRETEVLDERIAAAARVLADAEARLKREEDEAAAAEKALKEAETQNRLYQIYSSERDDFVKHARVLIEGGFDEAMALKRRT